MGDSNPRLRDSLYNPIAQLQRQFTLCPTRHSDILINIIQGTFRDHNTPSQILDAVIVGLDVEWYESGPKSITELGLAIMDSRDLPSKGKIWDVFRKMRVHHFRVKENAHMVNTNLCPGRPDKFQFGTTRFVDMEEAGKVLLRSFTWPHEVGGHLRPVVLMGHAIDNDLAMIQKYFRIDIEALGCVVTTVDTQKVAQEASIRSPSGGLLISLKDMLAYFGIREDYLHTAGNDIGYTLIAGFLASNELLQHSSHWSQILAKDSPKVAQQCVQWIKSMSRTAPQHTVGAAIFCTRCDSSKHLAHQCIAAMYCNHCAHDPRKRGLARAHKTQKCLSKYELLCTRRAIKKVVVPCLACSNSTDSKRWTRASTHEDKDCFYRVRAEMN